MSSRGPEPGPKPEPEIELNKTQKPYEKGQTVPLRKHYLKDSPVPTQPGQDRCTGGQATGKVVETLNAAGSQALATCNNPQCKATITVTADWHEESLR